MNPTPTSPAPCQHEETIVRNGIPQCSECGKHMPLPPTSPAGADPLDPCKFCGSETAPHLGTAQEIYDVDRMHYPGLAVVCDVNKGGCGACGGFEQTPTRAIAAWNRKPRRASPPQAPAGGLVWTREKPKRAGWYWHRSQSSMGVASVYLAPFGFLVHFNGAARPSEVSEVGGYWSGPIPEPAPTAAQEGGPT